MKIKIHFSLLISFNTFQKTKTILWIIVIYSQSDSVSRSVFNPMFTQKQAANEGSSHFDILFVHQKKWGAPRPTGPLPSALLGFWGQGDLSTKHWFHISSVFITGCIPRSRSLNQQSGLCQHWSLQLRHSDSFMNLFKRLQPVIFIWLFLSFISEICPSVSCSKTRLAWQKCCSCSCGGKDWKTQPCYCLNRYFFRLFWLDSTALCLETVD